jgi:hypothetical protein
LDRRAFTRIFRGVTDGIHETFYPTGEIRQVVDYRDGHLFKALDHYPNGQLSEFWRDSVQYHTLRQWCPNGKLVGDMTVHQKDPELRVARGHLLLADPRSGEPFTLIARRSGYALISHWDGERLKAHTDKELFRLMNGRDLGDGSFQDPDELPWMMRYALCD